MLHHVALADVDGVALGEVDALDGLLAGPPLGGFLAALALPRLARQPVGQVTLGALLLGAPGVLGLAAAPGPAYAVAPLLLWSTSTTLVVLNGINARQLATPDHLQARVNTTARMVAWGGTPVGALTAGAFAGPLGVRTTVAGSVVAVLAALALGLATGMGRRDFGQAQGGEPGDGDRAI